MAIVGKINQIDVNDSQFAIDLSYLNLNDFLENPNAYASKQSARGYVPTYFRTNGRAITYKLALGNDYIWVSEQFIGSSWSTADADWLDLGPVKVTQNTNTRHTEIHIGSNDYQVPSIKETLNIDFVSGIAWNNSTVGNVVVKQANANWASILVECVVGDKFNIKANGGTSFKLCATLDADKKVVRVVSNATTLTTTNVTIEEGEVYLTINTAIIDLSNSYCERCDVQNNIANLYNKLSNLQESEFNGQTVFNLNKDVEDTNYTAATARQAVPSSLRKKGLIIVYKVGTLKYVIEQFVGANPQTSESEWKQNYNWETISVLPFNVLSTQHVESTTNYLAFSKYPFENLIAGHIYRVYLSNKNVSVGSSGTIFVVNTQQNTTSGALVTVSAGTALKDYYDVTMPANKTELYFGIKCDGDFFCSILDITATRQPEIYIAHTSATDKEKSSADYIVDNSTAASVIQSAINSLTNGGVIRLSTGEFVLSTYIDLQDKSNICLIGTGILTTIKRQDAYVIRTNASSSNIELDSLNIIGTVTFTHTRGVIKNCWINRVYIELVNSVSVKQVLPNEGLDGIITAIDELPSDGGLVLLKEGTYQGATPITFSNNKTNVRIVGVGTKTVLERYNVNPEVEARNASITGCTLENLKLVHSIRRDKIGAVPCKMLRLLNCYIADEYYNESDANNFIIECGQDKPIKTLNIAYQTALTYPRSDSQHVEIHIYGHTVETDAVVVQSPYIDIIGHNAIVEFRGTETINMKFINDYPILVQNVHFLKSGCYNTGNFYCTYVSNNNAKFVNCVFDNQSTSPSPYNQGEHDYGYEDPYARRRHGILVELTSDTECKTEFHNCIGVGSPYGTNSCRGWYISYGAPKLFNCIGYGGGIGEYGHGILCHRASHPDLFNCVGYAGNRSYRRSAGIRMQAAGSPQMIGCVGHGNCNVQYISNGVPYATLHSKCETLGITDESFFYNGSTVDYDGLTPKGTDDGYNADRLALLGSITIEDIDYVELNSQAEEGFGIHLWTGSQDNRMIGCIGYAGAGAGSCGLMMESSNRPIINGGYFGVEDLTDYVHFTKDSGESYMTFFPEGVTRYTPYAVRSIVIVGGTQAYIAGDYIKVETDEATPKVLCNTSFENDNINVLPIVETAVDAGVKLKVSIVNNGVERSIADDSIRFKVGYYYNESNSPALRIAGGNAKPEISDVHFEANMASSVINIVAGSDYNIISSRIKSRGNEVVIDNDTENDVRCFNCGISGDVSGITFAQPTTISNSNNYSI